MMLKRKLRREVGIQSDPGYPQLGMHHYLPYLEGMHAELKPDVYFEIGTESGASLGFAHCTSIAVDPVFRLDTDVAKNKPELHLYQGTSDDFFASGMLDRLGLKIDFAFLDGMHLFEFLLRDFMNTEKYMSPDGVMTIHDCVPYNALVAEREWDKDKTSSWTGDVWKLLPVLREYRPDLSVEVLDLAPTGLVKISGFDPDNTVLSDKYEELVQDYQNLSIEQFGLDRFCEAVDLQRLSAQLQTPSIVPDQRIFSTWEEPERAAKASRNIALKTAVPNARQKEVWGDYHFARGLADAFLRLGHCVKIDSVREWHKDAGKSDLDIVLFGAEVYTPTGDTPMIGWVLYPGREEEDLTGGFDRAAHMYFASPAAASEFNASKQNCTGEVLWQCFDPKLMYPPDRPADEGMVFVGSNHYHQFGPRQIVEYAVQNPWTFKLWGKAWKRHPAKAWLQDQYLPNARLGDVYRDARIVLCDHMPSMSRDGYVSNRIFDALACGAAVISDPVENMPADFDKFVHCVSSQDEFDAAVSEIRAEGATRRKARMSFAKDMHRRHSFDERAKQILEKGAALSLF